MAWAPLTDVAPTTAPGLFASPHSGVSDRLDPASMTVGRSPGSSPRRLRRRDWKLRDAAASAAIPDPAV